MMTPEKYARGVLVQIFDNIRQTGKAAVSRAIREAVLEEREACAQVCEDIARSLNVEDSDADSPNPEDRAAWNFTDGARECTDRIRARPAP